MDKNDAIELLETIDCELKSIEQVAIKSRATGQAVRYMRRSAKQMRQRLTSLEAQATVVNKTSCSQNYFCPALLAVIEYLKEIECCSGGAAELAIEKLVRAQQTLGGWIFDLRNSTPNQRGT